MKVLCNEEGSYKIEIKWQFWHDTEAARVDQISSFQTTPKSCKLNFLFHLHFCIRKKETQNSEPCKMCIEGYFLSLLVKMILIESRGSFYNPVGGDV